MEEELISKKDLLDETGISYGQLYRWKRKQLIPEEWFIRKSTFTGQETFSRGNEYWGGCSIFCRRKMIFLLMNSLESCQSRCLSTSLY